jgi:hypothetical protein
MKRTGVDGHNQWAGGRAVTDIIAPEQLCGRRLRPITSDVAGTSI